MRRPAWFLWAALLGACGVAATGNAGRSEKGGVPEMESTRADPAVRGTVDCGTAEQPSLRRMCGTTTAEMEFVPEASMSPRKRLSLGERAAEASDHVRAVNRHVANIRAARPELIPRLLRDAAADTRTRALRMCELEGAGVPSQLALSSDILSVFVWMAYRRALIEEDSGVFLRQVDSLLAHPCFREESALYFASRPAAFASPGDSVYSLPRFIAAALSYYHRHKGEPLVSDAYAFRGEIDVAGEARSACLERAFEADRSALSGLKGKLWDRCLRLVAADGSCMTHQRQCSP